MKMSPAGRDALMKREGVRLKAYLDSVGVWTIGVGHTSAAGPPKVTPGLTITREECDEIFSRDLVKYETAVLNAVKRPLTQGQFDALVSLCFNIGPGGFARSTVVKRINAGDMEGAAHAFMMWNKPPEIIGRRTGEMKQFMASATYPETLQKSASNIRGKKPKAAPGAVVVAGGAVAEAVRQTGEWQLAAYVLLAALVVAGAVYLWLRVKNEDHAAALEDAANFGENFHV